MTVLCSYSVEYCKRHHIPVYGPSLKHETVHDDAVMYIYTQSNAEVDVHSTSASHKYQSISGGGISNDEILYPFQRKEQHDGIRTPIIWNGDEKSRTSFRVQMERIVPVTLNEGSITIHD